MESKEVNLGRQNPYACIKKVALKAQRDLERAGRPRMPQLQALFEWLEKKSLDKQHQ